MSRQNLQKVGEQRRCTASDDTINQPQFLVLPQRGAPQQLVEFGLSSQDVVHERSQFLGSPGSILPGGVTPTVSELWLTAADSQGRRYYSRFALSY